MKLKSFFLWSLMIIGAISCKYDDGELWNKVNDLDERLTNIEGQLTQMNTNISSMSSIVNALEANVYVTSVTETENGYTITFSDGQTASIANGTAGKDAPVIGFNKDTDGKYYWTQTIDGQQDWLTDENGNKIPVTGNDAVTPQLKVSTTGYWMISYDHGLTFVEVLDENGNPVKAVGEPGASGDSWFSNVSVENGEVIFVLKDGTEIRIPFEGEEEIPSINYDEFNIVNNGDEVKGAVEEITEEGNDGQPLTIVQTVPSISELMPATASVKYASIPLLYSERTNTREQQMGYTHSISRAGESTVTFPANLPIMFFFDDKILLPSIKDNFVVTVDGVDVKGTITINASSTGNAIITFTPWEEFQINVSITITVKKGMMDKNGNEMLQDVVLSYITNNPEVSSFDGNTNFENGNDGIYLIGDGSIMEGSVGDMVPQEGSHYAAISSGNCLVSADGYAIGGTSSMMILGPIEKNIKNLSFHYDFISAEFNEWVGSVFDDCVVMTIYGPYGSYSIMLTSVNIIGQDNTQFNDYPNMPDEGDPYAGHIGWTAANINDIPYVGTPAYISFTVTDVGDTIYSSIFTIDNINY